MDEHAEMFFRADYWKFLAPSLTSLTLGFGDFELPQEVPRQWLQSLLLLRNLESWSSVKLVSIESGSC